MACNTAGNPTVWFGHKLSPEIPRPPIASLAALQTGRESGHESRQESWNLVAAEDRIRTLSCCRRNPRCSDDADISPCQNPSPKCPLESSRPRQDCPPTRNQREARASLSQVFNIAWLARPWYCDKSRQTETATL
jgi:hypothetical protein